MKQSDPAYSRSFDKGVFRALAIFSNTLKEGYLNPCSIEPMYPSLTDTIKARSSCLNSLCFLNCFILWPNFLRFILLTNQLLLNGFLFFPTVCWTLCVPYA